MTGDTRQQHRARHRLGVGAVAIALVVGACGVSQDDGPRTIAADDVPFALLDQPSTATTVAPSPANARTVTVYLLDAKGALRPATRMVQAPITTAKVVNALLQPITPAETVAGLATAITADTVLRGLDGPVEGQLTVDLSSTLLKVTGRRQIQALAQVVFTVTDLTGVRRVVFEFDGRRRDVPQGDGGLTSSPLDRGDYSSLEPPDATTTTTAPPATTTSRP